MTSISTLNHVAALHAESELERLLLRAPRALKRIDRNYWRLFRAIISSNRKRKRLRLIRARRARSVPQITSA